LAEPHEHLENDHPLDNHGPHEHDMVAEEPLDPANQSLADALRLSFRVLKVVMVGLIVLFILSGAVMVDQREVVVLSRFGRLVDKPLSPGLHFAWPYPIDEQVRVSTSLRDLSIDSFWLRLNEKEKMRSLSDLSARSQGLDPAMDGALLTGDRAIMHMLLNVEYRVNDKVRIRADRTDPAEQLSDVILFVNNVGNEQQLLTSVMQNAAVAEAARTTADVIWKDAQRLAKATKKRAQAVLDGMETGIVLEKVAAEQSHYPLQAKREFLGVSQAENRKRELINAAESERTKKLLGVAGPAWSVLSELIERLDQVEDEAERTKVIDEINEVLATRATGESGGMIRMAQRDRENILNETLSEVARFHAYLPEYRRSPELVRKRLQTQMLSELLDKPGIIKWWMPPGEKKLIFSLNKDPQEIRQAERDRLKGKTGLK